MSRPSEPVETVSTSIDLLFLPSRMIEPLPKLRSIWESAASRAFDLSMEEPSTRRSADGAIALTPLMTGIRRTDNAGRMPVPPGRRVAAMYTICSPFAICSSRCKRYWPVFLTVAGFETCGGRFLRGLQPARRQHYRGEFHVP